MNTLNIKKRFEERLSVIRRQADFLPDGRKRIVLNNCAKLALYAAKAGKQLQTALTRVPHSARSDARDVRDFAKITNSRDAVWEALLQGRELSLHDAEEFQTSQMHTQFTFIRKRIAKRGLPYILCDEWVPPGEGKCRYKKYWIQQKSGI